MAGRGGGAKLPRLPSVIKKINEKLGHSHCFRLCRLGMSNSCRSENKSPYVRAETTPKKQKFPSHLKNPKKLKSSEKNENRAIGYLKHQQLKKNNEKNFGRMREILGAYRKKPITRKSLLWNFEISISEWCDISLVTWPLRINNPIWNWFINGFIRAILKKSTFPENPIGAKKFSELLRRIGFLTITQTVRYVGQSNSLVK